MNRPQQFPLTVGIVTCVANAVCVHHCHAAQLFRQVKAAAYFHAYKESTLHCHELVIYKLKAAVLLVSCILQTNQYLSLESSCVPHAPVSPANRRIVFSI